MEVSITIKNMAAIKRAFGAAPQAMRKNLTKAIHKSVLMVERESKQITPVDTGRLRASHRTLFKDLYGEVGTHVFYDVFVHEGTRYMRGRPYLRNAVNSADYQIQLFFQQAVQDTLNETGKAT